jgi:hypothetical protein
MQVIAPEVQMHAMLDGTTYTLLCQSIQNPERIDIR